MRWLADISYPVFLFHYSVCMVCGAWVGRMWPGDVAAHTLGLFGTWGLCLLVGWAVTEGEGRWRRARQARMARPAQTCASLAQ
jgi:peptidoglycan/LPS O-acetylase OafA/YrhL